MCTMQEREKRVLEALAINSLDGTIYQKDV